MMRHANSRAKQLIFLFVVFVMGLFNVVGTQSTGLSAIIAFAEYAIVIYLLIIKADYSLSFFYYIAFMAISVENPEFIFGDASVNYVYYNFLNLPFLRNTLRWLLAFIYVGLAHNKYIKEGGGMLRAEFNIKKGLNLLFVSGILSVLVAMLFNDNRIMDYPDIYPMQAIIDIVFWGVKACIILTAIYLSFRTDWISECSVYFQLTLIAVSLYVSLSAFLGFTGRYGNANILQSPVSIALTPMLLLFTNKKQSNNYRLISVVSALLIIIVSFLFGGTTVGSKWYLIIVFTLLCLIIRTNKIKSIVGIALIVVGLLMLINLVLEPLLVLFGDNDYIGFKLSQAMGTINIFGAGNVENLFENMGESPLYRFDELHNIFIEYTQKPWYALFGKGLGGTIQHHTSVLYWESGDGNFSMEQIRMGAYWRMHESLAVFFLQHGIVGIAFFIYVMYELIRRIYMTPWAAVAFIWFLFYWSYGNSAMLGGVAIALALSMDNKQEFRRLE